MAHHYVPRYYLRHFALDSNESHVHSMSADYTIHDEPSPISNICAKKNYNTPLQEREQDNLEKKHSKILRDFINTPNPETFSLSYDFVESVSFMMGNNIYIREAISKAFCEILSRILKPIFSNYISSDIGYRGQLKSSIAFADCVFEEFQRWKFVRHGPINGLKVYTTSDNPVSIFYPENVFAPWKTSINLKDVSIDIGDESIPISKGVVSAETKFNLTFDSVSLGQDVVMFFPITPSVCLLGFSNSTRHLRFINRTPRDNNDILVFMNLITFSQCNKIVYSHSKGLLEDTKINMPKFLNHCQRHGYPPSFDAGIA